MEQKQFTVDITTEEILKGKFSNTIATIQSYKQEADDTNDAYWASTVLGLMTAIQDAFNADLDNLAKSIQLNKESSEEKNYGMQG